MLNWVHLVLLSWFCPWTQAHVLDDESWTDQAVLSDGLCHYGNTVECCWGWRQMDRGRCQPHCQQGCKHGECVGPYRCTCHPGFTGKACNQDLNECGLKPRPCKHRCMNTLGSYKCYCLDGHALQPDGSCRNARTCYHASCQYGCEVIKGAVRCTCPSPGLQLGPDRRTCVDIDECALGRSVCPRRRKCVNTFGSFLCKCHHGFKLTYINGRYTCLDKDTRPFCSLNPSSPKCRCRAGRCTAVPKVNVEPQRPRTTAPARTTTPTTTPLLTTTTILTTTLATSTIAATTTTPTTTPATATITPSAALTTSSTRAATTTSDTTTTTTTPTATSCSSATTTLVTTTSSTTIPSTISTTINASTAPATTTIASTTTSTPLPTTPELDTTITTTTPTSTATTTTISTTAMETTASTTAALTTMMPTTIAMETTTMNNWINVTHKPRGDVHIPRHPSNDQVLEFDIELGDTARDDPEAGVLRCTFDHGLCGWMSDREGDLRWETAHSSAGGSYLSVSQLKAGQRSTRGARLAVQIVPTWRHGDLCFSFSHWLTGHHVGVLQLFVRTNGRDQRYSPALWSRTGGHGWRHTQVTLTMHSLDRVMLKAERRHGRGGRIAVDDVTLRQGVCQ